MKHLGLVMIGLLAISACEKASPGPKIQPGLSIQLTRVPPSVGDRMVRVQTMDMTMSFEVKGIPVKVKQKQHDEELKTVLAVDGFAVSRVQVTYRMLSETSEMLGKTETKSGARQGKTYIVSRDDDLLRATYEDGSTPPDEELKKVLDGNDGVGVPDEWDAIVAARIWKSGERYTFTTDELTRINESKARANEGTERTIERWTRCELMLRSVENGVAVFSIVMGVRLEDEQGTTELLVDGDVRVEQATGRLLETSGHGPINGTTEGIPFRGSVTVREQTRWTAAP
jgi:hypothetical protein